MTPLPFPNRQYVPAAQRRDTLRLSLLLVGPVVLCAVVALLASLAMPKIYAARAEIVFQSLREADLTEAYRATQTVIVGGQSVLGPTAQTLQMPIEEMAVNFSATFPKGGTVMQLQYSDRDADMAVSTLNLIIDRYIMVLNGMEAGDQATHRLLVPPFRVTDPIQPKPIQALIIGLVVGLAISLAAFAWIRRPREQR
jgi:capsular polysaccharide biosynthesis protein